MSLDFDSARLPNPHLTELHHAWRAQLRKFIDTEIMPYADDWDEAGAIPIELWPKAAEVGLLGLGYPEAYGGTPGDTWLGEIAAEELGRVGAGGINASLMVHNIGLPPVMNWGSEAMKKLRSARAPVASATTQPSQVCTAASSRNFWNMMEGSRLSRSRVW